MDSKIAGIPLVLIMLIVIIVALIDGPMILLHAQNQNRFNQLEGQEQVLQMRLNRVETGLMTPTAVATPEATPTPTKVLKRVGNASSSAQAR